MFSIGNREIIFTEQLNCPPRDLPDLPDLQHVSPETNRSPVNPGIFLEELWTPSPRVREDPFSQCKDERMDKGMPGWEGHGDNAAAVGIFPEKPANQHNMHSSHAGEMWWKMRPKKITKPNFNAKRFKLQSTLGSQTNPKLTNVFFLLFQCTLTTKKLTSETMPKHISSNCCTTSSLTLIYKRCALLSARHLSKSRLACLNEKVELAFTRPVLIIGSRHIPPKTNQMYAFLHGHFCHLE